jgi:hypothetical protein
MPNKLPSCMFALKLCCALILAGSVSCAKQEGRNLHMPNPSPSPDWSLPINPASPSSMVSATHLLRIRLEALQIRGVALPPNEGKGRDLILRVKLEDVFKGHLREASGTVATLTVRQKGLDAIGEGPPPTLDPAALTIGQSYLIDAVHPGAASLEEVFAEGSLRGVYPAGYALDASLAQSMEDRFARSTPNDSALLERLLATCEARKAELHGLFGAYLWLRLAPKVEAEREATLDRLLRLALDANTQSGLAITLLSEFDTLALDLEARPAELNKLVRAYAASLGRELPMVVKRYIATQNLYNIVFDEAGRPSRSAADFGISPATAEQAKRMIGALGGDRVKSLVQWLH